MSAHAAPGEIISVIGEGVGVGVPDTVEVAVAIRAAGATVAQALREHASRAMAVMQLLGAKGVGNQEVRMTAVSVLPLLPSAAQSHAAVGSTLMPGAFADPVPATYLASSGMRVAMTDMNRIADVLDGLAAAGQHLAMALTHKVSDEAAMRRGALDAAMNDARLKAQMLAAASGRQLAAPLSIIEESHPSAIGAPAGVGSPAAPVNGVVGGGECAVRIVLRVSYAVR